MNLAAAISVYGYGTSEGVRKEWDTRGRGRKETVHTFYHGTVLPTAKKILKEGLKQEGNSTFKVNAIPASKKGYVYATNNEWIARMFAETRAAYDKAKPGETFSIHGHELTKREEGMPEYTVPSNERPAVIELEIPAKVVKSFVADPDDINTHMGQPEAFLRKGIIPKEYVKKVSLFDKHGDEGEEYWHDATPEELAAAAVRKLYLVYCGPLAALKMHLKAGQ